LAELFCFLLLDASAFTTGATGGCCFRWHRLYLPSDNRGYVILEGIKAAVAYYLPLGMAKLHELLMFFAGKLSRE